MTTQAPGGVQYDASGDIVADGSNQYLYNGDGQICAVHNMTGWTEYIYDAEGRRVAAVNGRAPVEQRLYFKKLLVEDGQHHLRLHLVEALQG